MFRKLIKYDLSFWKNSVLGVVAVMVFIALIICVCGINIFTDMLWFLPGIIIAASVTVCIVCAFQNFNKNLFSNEGYFMLTLPAKRHKLVASKLLASVVWSNIMLVVVSVILLVISQGYYFIYDIMEDKSILFELLLKVLIVIIQFNLFSVNGILLSYLFSVATHISVRSRRGGLIFGFVCSGSFLALEAFFYEIIARPVLDGLALWIVKEGSNNMPARLTLNVLTSRDTLNILVASVEIALIMTLILFSVIAYIIVLHCLKKRVDLQ